MSAGTGVLSLKWLLSYADSQDAPASETGPPDDGDAPPPNGCVVYSAASLYEAQLVLDLLQEAGIAASVFNQHLVGALGELPFQECLPRIWLQDEADWEPARRVIEQYETRSRDTADGTRSCPSCGETGPANFELCWSCRAPFDEEATE